MKPQTFFSLIKGMRFTIDNEKQVEADIAERLANLDFRRQYKLDDDNIPDFFFPESGLTIELKIKGNKRAIYQQIRRYAVFDEVTAIILLTSRSMGLPATINGKPIFIYNFSQAWL